MEGVPWRALVFIFNKLLHIGLYLLHKQFDFQGIEQFLAFKDISFIVNKV